MTRALTVRGPTLGTSHRDSATCPATLIGRSVLSTSHEPCDLAADL